MDGQVLLNFLCEQGLLTQDQSIEILEEQNRTGKRVEQIIQDYDILSEDQIMYPIAESLHADYVDLTGAELDPETLAAIPPKVARTHRALPIGYEEDGSILLALADPLDGQAIDDIRYACGRDIRLIVAPPRQVDELVTHFYGTEEEEVDEILSELSSEVLDDSEEIDLNDQAQAAPIIKFVNSVLVRAIEARASDIHFEPFEKEFKIRYRVDGALYEMAPPPRRLALPIISRIKVMSNLNIAERRIPQDGRIQTMMANRPIDLRVSTLPTQFGESVVLRVLDRSVVNLELEKLGIPEKIYEYILETIKKPNGIFIVTGPTGSGKTTTLYSCLAKINTIDTKILTAEDPVEYELEGIQQVACQDSIGLNFARVLRAFLRQDPDRILVGETRDLETAQIAIQASLTGHLVLTSLHTNDAAGAVTRLLDMGVEPFLIAATLEGILAQRLLRRICKDCITPYEPDENVLNQLGLSPHDIGDKNFYFGNGCPTCNETGYRGRLGIYELLDVLEPIRILINERAPSLVIKQKAIELGMDSLRQDGLRNIFDGNTTIEEVLKYT